MRAVVRARPRSRGRLEPPEVVVGGAGALGRHHARADRALRGARGAEHTALPWPDRAPKDLAALAGPRVLEARSRHAEAPLGVEVGELVGDPQGAVGDLAEPAPLEPLTQLEDLIQDRQGTRVALGRDR